MINREKAIKGLEETEILLTQIVNYDSSMSVREAFSCLNRVTYALAMLEEHEPKVMTPEEIKAYDGYCWFEKKNTVVMCVSLIKDGLVFDFGDPPYNVELLNWPYYGKDWRCWSAQPTDEQRKAVKWND